MAAEIIVMNPSSFNSFVVGNCNSSAYTAAMAVARRPGIVFNPLQICGETGLGATHLLRAIGYAVAAHKNDAKTFMISGEAFAWECMRAVRNRAMAGFRKQCCDVDVLLLDDIHYVSGKEQVQAELIKVFVAMLAEHRQIALTSAPPICDIPQIDHRLVALCAPGVIKTLGVPDLETRIGILQKKREILNLQIEDEMLAQIARHIHTNIRHMVGAMIRVSAYRSLTGKQLNMADYDRLLRDGFAD